MHTPVCRDAREFWPEGAPTDIAVGSLPAVGAVTNPIRIKGCGPWLGFWGPSFAGLRVGFSPTQTFPVINGLAVPYPIDPDDEGGVDLFLSRDAGGGGTVTVARFKTEEAARAWGGQPTPGTGSSFGAELANRTTAGRDAVAGGVITHNWTQSGFLYALLVAAPANAADIIIGGAFHLRAGASVAGFVGAAATGFSATGTNGDIIDFLEFGRV